MIRELEQRGLVRQQQADAARRYIPVRHCANVAKNAAELATRNSWTTEAMALRLTAENWETVRLQRWLALLCECNGNEWAARLAVVRAWIAWKWEGRKAAR